MGRLLEIECSVKSCLHEAFLFNVMSVDIGVTVLRRASRMQTNRVAWFVSWRVVENASKNASTDNCGY